MEQFADYLKTRLKDPAYDYRQDSFLSFLKSPLRDFKESPTVKDYVRIEGSQLESMASTTFGRAEAEVDSDADILLQNGFISRAGNIEGLIIKNIGDQLNEIPLFVWGQKGKEREEFLINAAWSSGYYMEVEPEKDITVSLDSFCTHQSGSEKNVIVVGKMARLNIAESRYSTGEGKRMETQGKSIYFFMEEGSTVNFNYLQDKGRNITDITFIRSFQKKNSSFNIYHVNHGASKVIFQNESYQEGDASDYRVYGISFTDGDQQADIRDSSFEIGKNSSADIQVRGVVTGASSTIHRGNVDIELESINSTGFYDSRILLLSKEGYANSKPGLMIKNNSTRSKHGSAISNIDSEQVLYLRSRGIGLKDATTLITGGFVGSLIEKSNNQKFIDIVNRFSEHLAI